MRVVFIILGGLISGSALSAQPGDSLLQRGELRIQAEPGIELLQQAYLEENKRDDSFSGYRVQIYNGRKTELLKKRSEFLSVFPKCRAYTLYDSPEYKLQVGDFRTRLEAEKFLKEVIKNFGSGFVVRTRIKPPTIK